jgi:hypothetical protein
LGTTFDSLGERPENKLALCQGRVRDSEPAHAVLVWLVARLANAHHLVAVSNEVEVNDTRAVAVRLDAPDLELDLLQDA